MWYMEHDILKLPNVMYKNIKYLFMSNSRISYSAIFLSLLKALPAYGFFPTHSPSYTVDFIFHY